MRGFLYLSGIVGVSACVVACAAGPGSGDLDGEGGEDTSTQDLRRIELMCASADGATTFSLKPAATGVTLDGTLGGSVESSFVCRAPRAGTDPSVFANCSERPQTVHEGRWRVRVTTDGTAFAATLLKGEESIALACSVPPPSTDALPTFAEVGPVLDQRCSRCHGEQFATLEKVKSKRASMITMISSGRMPKTFPGWFETDQGKMVLRWLQESPELR